MGYISLEPVTINKLVCNHPKVKYIWEYGGLAGIPSSKTPKRYIGIILKENDGKIERVEFEDEGDGKAIEDAEKFLSELK